MHALKNWADCHDPTCKCNDWLAKLPPVMPFVTEREPSTKVGRYEREKAKAT